MLLDDSGSFHPVAGDDASARSTGLRTCECGSGLSNAQCCALDRRGALPAGVEPAPEVLESLYAVRRGTIGDASKLCLDLLSQTPNLLPALHLLFLIRRDQRNRHAALVLIRRLARLAPRDPGIACELGGTLLAQNLVAEAEDQARHALRLAPASPEAHALLGRVFMERKDFLAAAFQMRQALRVAGGRSPTLLLALAQALTQQGALEEARDAVKEAQAQEPDNLAGLILLSQIEEYGHNVAAATTLLVRAAQLAPNAAPLREAQARLAFAAGDTRQTLAVLDDPARPAPLGIPELLLRGRALDRLGRTDEAFATFEAAQRIGYDEAEAATQRKWINDSAAHYKAFFCSTLMDSLPRAETAPIGMQPIFIAGFARSGTTMMEQSLSMHGAVTAGGEIHSLRHVVRNAQRLLHSVLPYPNALTELWMGDRRQGLTVLRDTYLNDAQGLHGIAGSKAAWFTDKMIFNEMHLALISLILPKAPIIHMIRHPLDVVLSVFSHQLSGGITSRNTLADIAAHYAATMDLVAHYRAEACAGRYLPVRYEDMVADQRGQMARVLDFVGLPFDEACLSFEQNTRYARTLSFTQVRRSLNTDGLYRYRNYLPHLAPIVPILAPHIERLGYTIG